MIRCVTATRLGLLRTRQIAANHSERPASRRLRRPVFPEGRVRRTAVDVLRSTLVTLCLCALAGPVAASPPTSARVPLRPPGDEAWQSLTFPSIDRHTRYEALQPGGEPAQPPFFSASSECAASALVIEAPPALDLAITPILEWSWALRRGLDIEDERTRDGDDFAARVYVLFRFDRLAASLARRLAHGLASRLSGREAPAAALNYVWASRSPLGSSWANPFRADAHMIALRTGSWASGQPTPVPLDEVQWRHERVDLVRDHARYIDGPGRVEVMAVAIMSDSDNSCQSAAAVFRDFAFSARQEQAKGSGPGGASPQPERTEPMP